ncbi:MAG: hypothetical protein ACJAVV_003820 [Alphaproteobacteria bacterium]|jgi:hypothetical protein
MKHARKHFAKGLLGALLLTSTFIFHSYAGEWVEPQLPALNKLKAQAEQSPLSYNIIESLTTEVGARLVGTPASDKSVDWAVAKMQELGFDKVWIEESTTTLWQRGDLKASIVSPYPHALVAISLGGSAGTQGKAL